MNKIRIILLSAFSLFATSTFAQYSKQIKLDKFDGKSIKTDGWHEFYFQVSPLKLSASNNINGTGYAIGYNKTFNIVKDKPIYLIAGANIQYSIFSNDTDGGNVDITISGTNGTTTTATYGSTVSTDISLYDLNIPVSVMYDIPVTGGFSIAPYAGIKLRAGLSGSITSTPSLNGLSTMEAAALAASLPSNFGETSSSVYDNDYTRFNIGWQAGVNFYLDNYRFGLSYGTLLNDITDDTTFKQASVTIGYRF